MKDNFVKVVFIIDNSGSMYDMKKDVVGGFNEFIENQKKELVGTENVSLYYFNDSLKCSFRNKDVHDVGLLSDSEYTTCGSTALYDSVCTVIDEVGKELNEMNEEDKPSSVILVIITDGYENSSTKYLSQDAKERIKHQTEKYSWKFVYLGADIENTKDAETIGITNIGLSHKFKYKETMKKMSDVVSQYRVSVSSGDSTLCNTLSDMNSEYETSSHS